MEREEEALQDDIRAVTVAQINTHKFIIELFPFDSG